MIATILGWILGIAFIGAGIVWAFGWFIASSLEQSATGESSLLPALLGIVPAMLGVFIIALVMR